MKTSHDCTFGTGANRVCDHLRSFLKSATFNFVKAVFIDSSELNNFHLGKPEALSCMCTVCIICAVVVSVYISLSFLSDLILPLYSI